MVRIASVVFFSGLISASILGSSGCTSRIALELDPTVEFGMEEQMVSATEEQIRIPIIMSRTSSEVVTVFIKIEGHPSLPAGTVSFPAGVNSGEIQLEMKAQPTDDSPKEIRITLTKSKFSRLGKNRVHVVKVVP